MIKNTVIALVTASALAGIAAPAMASSSLIESSSDSDFDAAYVLAQLEAKGVAADSVEEWGDYVVAIVTDATGKQTLTYFQPTTLEQVNL